MASALMRRSAFTTVLAAAATIASPLAGTAHAATITPTAKSPTSTVANSQPTVSETWSANLDGTSTIALRAGTATGAAVGCTASISGATISCTPTGLLPQGDYTAVVHAVGGGASGDDSWTFHVNVPKRTSASPAAGTSVASLTAAGGKISATFDQAIDDQHSTMQVQQIVDANGTPDVHTPLTGSTSTSGGSKLPIDQNNDTTISFTPSDSTFGNGVYQVTATVYGVTASGTPGVPNTYNSTAKTVDSYTFTIDNTPPAVPSDLSAPAAITQANQSAVRFTGKANPGNTVTVVLSDGTGSVDNTGTNNGGPVTVAQCGTTPCPWAVTLDASGLSDTTSGSWTVTAHNGAGDTAASPVAIVKDTTPPAAPSVAASFTPANSATLHVSGSDTDAVDHYVLKVADADGHQIGPMTLDHTNGGITGSSTIGMDIDASSLDDGTITVTVAPFDTYGNGPTSSSGYGTATSTKAVGVLPVFSSSAFVPANGGANVSFPTVLARTPHAVQPPATIAVEFTNPITLTRKDTCTCLQPTDIHAPQPYLVDNGGAGNQFLASAVVDSSDSRRLIVTPPAGLTDGAYTLHVSAFEAQTCATYDSGALGNQPAPACPTYDGFVDVPSSTSPFVFTVDRVAPTTTLAMSNVDADTITAAPISGTTEPGANVVVTLKSSGGGSTFFANPGGTTADSQGHWAITPDLRSVPDGTLTVQAVAGDVAGNTSAPVTVSPAPVLQARPSAPRNLGVAAGNAQAVLAWSAPATAGAADRTITSYLLSYTDTTAGTPAQTVSLAGTAMSVHLSGLNNGHTYSFQVAASNADTGKPFVGGAGAPATTSATPRGATVLSTIAPRVTTYGAPVSVHGVLTYGGVGLGGKPVTVTSTYWNGAHGPTWQLTTDSYGNWYSPVLRASKNITFAASYAGESAFAPASSAARMVVKVAIRITKVSARNSSHLTAVTIHGVVAPNMHGRTVYIYEKVGRRNVRLGSLRLTSKSTFAYVRKFARGRHYVFAAFGTQNGNQGNNSQTVKFSRS